MSARAGVCTGVIASAQRRDAPTAWMLAHTSSRDGLGAPTSGMAQGGRASSAAASTQSVCKQRGEEATWYVSKRTLLELPGSLSCCAGEGEQEERGCEPGHCCLHTRALCLGKLPQDAAGLQAALAQCIPATLLLY